MKNILQLSALSLVVARYDNIREEVVASKYLGPNLDKESTEDPRGQCHFSDDSEIE